MQGRNEGCNKGNFSVTESVMVCNPQLYSCKHSKLCKQRTDLCIVCLLESTIPRENHSSQLHCKKGFVILTIIFSPELQLLTWFYGKILEQSLVITSYGQYSEHGVATGTIEFATRAGKIAWTADKCYMQQKGIIPSQRSLSCELQYNYLCSK